MKRSRAALDAVSVLLYPRRCALCGEVIEAGKKLCPECKKALRPTGDLCRKCGKIKEHCRCDDDRFHCEYAAFAAPFYFDKSIAKGIVRFKNFGYTELADSYADEIVKCIEEQFGDVRFDCVTYIPLRKMRERKRGYNQAQLLAAAIAKRLDIPVEDLLIKTRRTKTQRTRSAKERRVNLHGAFDLAFGKEADGKCVLLVDDIKTTGSTLNECALTLRAYGADAIYACAVAVVDEDLRKADAKQRL
jgi:ComF family protein